MVRTVKLILAAVLLGLMASCTPDDDTTCEDKIEYINYLYDQKMKDQYNLCPDKCDYSAEIKVIQKERRAALNELNCE